MFLFFLLNLYINVILCNDEYPPLYAIAQENESIFSVFARVGDCLIWKSTTNNFFFYKDLIEEGYWGLVEDPEVNEEQCTVKNKEDVQHRLNGLKKTSKDTHSRNSESKRESETLVTLSSIIWKENSNRSKFEKLVHSKIILETYDKKFEESL